MTTPAHPDPIRIPFATKMVLVSGDVYRTDTCGIDITPDIARQIMALAGIPALEGERINAVERRIAALEAFMKRDQDAVAAAVRDIEASLQEEPALMSTATPAPASGSRLIVTDHPDAYKTVPNPAPASGGDEAVVEALRNLTFTDGNNQPLCLFSWKGDECRNAARAILAAIRSGAIPLPEDVPQIAALRAKLAEAERTSHSVTGCDQCAEHKADTEAMRADRDALAKRLAEAVGGIRRVTTQSRNGVTKCTVVGPDTLADLDALLAEIGGGEMTKGGGK